MSSHPRPDHSYMARDYASFRSLLSDHLLRSLADAGGEPPVASIEMALVEAMAYVADYLSYYQDAVGTEAYPQTARQRISLARHARLLGRRLNEGCCARTLIHFEIAAERVELPMGTQLLTAVPGWTSLHVPEDFSHGDAISFTTLHPVTLCKGKQRLSLAQNRAPSAGDCSVHLAGQADGMTAGDVVLLQTQDDRWAQAVRLRRVTRHATTTHIEWHSSDALRSDLPTGAALHILGNIALAEEGHFEQARQPVKPNGPAGPWLFDGATPAYAAASGDAPACALLDPDPETAEPVIILHEGWHAPTGHGWPHRTWHARRDLVGAGPSDRVFVVEADRTGQLRLRFATEDRGLQPDPAMPLFARYRVSRGSQGNIAADTIAHLVGADHRIIAIGNPLPARGGCDPEPLEAARLRIFAGHQRDPARRCVTPDDYCELVRQQADVLACTAKVAATGPLRKIELAVLRAGNLPVDVTFIARLREEMAPAVLLGDVIEIMPSMILSPRISLTVTHLRDQQASAIKQAVISALCQLPPLPAGEAAAAAIIAAALEVPGVSACRIINIGEEAANGAPSQSGLEGADGAHIQLDPALISLIAGPAP